MFGSITTTFGAEPSNCTGGERNVDGCTDGIPNCCGKPCESRVPAGIVPHPGVDATPYVVAVQEYAKPGSVLAAAAEANVGIESKAIPYPVWITVLLNAFGAQTIPMRGASASKFWRLYQLSAFTKVTAPCDPSIGLLATYGDSLTSVGGRLYSQRTP